jgi:hypothetical protein
VSGRKADLIQRIVQDDDSKGNKSSSDISKSNRSKSSNIFSENSSYNNVNSSHNEKVEKYLVDLVKYYISQCGGYASSRELGRFLATNRASNSDSTSALAELKDRFGGVSAFLNQRSHIFTTVREPNDGDPKNFSFGIMLKDPTSRPNSPVGNNYSLQPSKSTKVQSLVKVDPQIDAHIEELIREYLHASGGEASSRNIGRYLAANAALTVENGVINPIGNSKSRETALKQLKHHYGSLAAYLNTKENVFAKISGDFHSSGEGEYEPPSEHSFGVRLKQ